jgi:hypothetical protein
MADVLGPVSAPFELGQLFSNDHLRRGRYRRGRGPLGTILTSVFDGVVGAQLRRDRHLKTKCPRCHWRVLLLAHQIGHEDLAHRLAKRR